jgi:hypothetical protein
MRLFGERGREVVRFEWRHYKRLLQPTATSQWVPKKMKTDAFFQRVYREDRMAEDNWGSIAHREREPRPVQTEQAGTEQQLHNEYMLATAVPGTQYSVRRPQPLADEAGRVHHDEQEVHFKLLNVSSSHSRLHIMHTVESADDVQLAAPLAWEVVYESEAHTEDAGTVPGARNVFADSPPTWVRPWDIAPFQSFRKTLLKWGVARSPVPGCLALCDSERARHPYNILETKCPTLSIIDYVQQKGWTPTRGARLFTSQTHPGRTTAQSQFG